jgi:hypothetical protein
MCVCTVLTVIIDPNIFSPEIFFKMTTAGAQMPWLKANSCSGHTQTNVGPWCPNYYTSASEDSNFFQTNLSRVSKKPHSGYQDIASEKVHDKTVEAVRHALGDRNSLTIRQIAVYVCYNTYMSMRY